MRRFAKVLTWSLLAACAASALYLAWLPDVSQLKGKNPSTTAYIELRRRQALAKGKKLAVQWTWVAWDAISENLKHAVLTAEDDSFYRHHGVAWDAVRVALERDIAERRLAYGGSTITQQTARNLYLSPSKNPLRKLKEALIARKLEKVLGKRRIFEIYLNIAEWGKGIFGAEAASRAYFGKSASDLSVDEAVALAVVLPSPRRHDPAKRGRYVDRNSRRIMARMRASGLLTEEEEVGMEEVLVSTAAVAGSMGAVEGVDLSSATLPDLSLSTAAAAPRQ
ncbi:MAG: monofunctional biosynthetic peptidoglycan transglycosylase [Elusimicrobia bacterium RIFCSPLOWO2_12_FULL_59_9]|nr:MAG: monofunctional biosynthetic peptidoglycan transglycosylase [Elusimicrobia bacterium RIFCSPLOWO2_12_FULL_59_9]